MSHFPPLACMLLWQRGRAEAESKAATEASAAAQLEVQALREQVAKLAADTEARFKQYKDQDQFIGKLPVVPPIVGQ